MKVITLPFDQELLRSELFFFFACLFFTTISLVHFSAFTNKSDKHFGLLDAMSTGIQ